MAEIDYTSYLVGIGDRLDLVNARLLDIQQGNASGNMSGLNDIAQALATDSTIDYTTQLVQLCKLVAWTDILLVILLVVMFVALGVFVGFSVTRWLKSRT